MSQETDFHTKKILDVPEFHPDPLPAWALSEKLTPFERAALDGDTVQRKQNDWIIRTLAHGHSRFAEIERRQDHTDQQINAVREQIAPIADIHKKFTTVRSIIVVGLLLPLAVLVIYDRLKPEPNKTNQTEKTK